VQHLGQTGDEPACGTLDLDNDVRRIAAVRRWTRETLAGLTEAGLEDIELVVNELASNAFDHGRSPRLLRLYRLTEPCFVRVEVDDSSPEPPDLGSSRLGGDRGRGMVIVNRLAKDWGVTHGIGVKTVWAEITCES
jgi:anti-sigma regulatory factor (Ser/Thr protein kinase)